MQGIITLCLEVPMPAGSARELLGSHIWMCLNQGASLTDPLPQLRASSEGYEDRL